jgi:protein-S-isoprenylcysteine O-methyltransferase Ste14
VKFLWDVVLGRVVPLVLFGAAAVFEAWRATLAQAAASSFAGAVEFASTLATCLFLALMCFSYLSRLPRRSGKRSLFVVLVTLGPLTSLALALAPHPPRVGLDLAGAILVTLGTAWSLAALAYLRTSFSVLPEARELVTRGPFALSRHPVYLGEAIAAVGLVVPLANARVLLLVPYFACQWLRLRWEEEVLAAEFPEYAAYAARVPRYLPFTAW